MTTCCDPRLVVVPWPVIGCPKAVRRTLDDPSASDDQPMTGHRTAQTSDRRPIAAKNCLWKRTFRNLNNGMFKIRFCDYRWLLLYKDFTIRKSIMGEIFENFRRISSGLNRRIVSWRFEQPLLFRSFLQTFICVDLAILLRCIHTRYACLISLQMDIKIQYCVTSHQSQVGIMKKPTSQNNGRSSDSPVFGWPCPKPVRLAESRVGTVAHRSLHNLDCFTVSTIPRSPSTYIHRLLHGNHCFTGPTLCSYTDLGNLRYFSV